METLVEAHHVKWREAITSDLLARLRRMPVCERLYWYPDVLDELCLLEKADPAQHALVQALIFAVEEDLRTISTGFS